MQFNIGKVHFQILRKYSFPTVGLMSSSIFFFFFFFFFFDQPTNDAAKRGLYKRYARRTSVLSLLFLSELRNRLLLKTAMLVQTTGIILVLSLLNGFATVSG